MTIEEFKAQFPRILLPEGHPATAEKLAKCLDFAERRGILEKFLNRIKYLNGYAGERSKGCCLFSDFSPFSFEFLVLDSEGNDWFNGGLVYFGAGESGVSGPQYSVRIGDTSEDWSIHT